MLKTQRTPAPRVNFTVTDLWTAAGKFAAWLNDRGYSSYDPYDIWGTRYGKLARRLYYRKHPAGALMTAPLILAEALCPQARRLFVAKDRYPTADAQLTAAFLNLYEAGRSRRAARRPPVHATPPEEWLGKARDLAGELLLQSVPGYAGHCWGYPFDWQNVHGLMPKATPHITATPYCYEAFARLYDLTAEEEYLEVVRSITAFVAENLSDTSTGNASAASSYTPYDRTKVVNASAYRAFVLFDASRRFGNDGFERMAWKNLRFILESQRRDGSWLYAIDSPDEAFIDHFHTCFVLKNLHKVNRHAESSEVERAIRRGFAWYRKALFDERDNPRLYAVAPRMEIVRLEMYNVAEAISLGVLLKDDIPEAFALANTLAERHLLGGQLPAGHWVTRVYRGGARHTLPFLRWPQSQLFLALTSLLAAAEHSGRRLAAAEDDALPCAATGRRTGPDGRHRVRKDAGSY